MDSIEAQQQNGTVYRTSNGVTVADLRNFVQDWLSEHPKGEIYVGTDSKARGDKVKYSTVICLWDVGHGVWEAYHNEWTSRPKDKFTRLWDEVNRSVAVAKKLQDLGQVHVHLDFNSNPEYPSYQLYDAGIGLVTSLGFNGAGKPHAWAATSGANRHCQ